VTPLRVCGVCGYAVDVTPCAVLVNGRLVLAVDLCADHRVALLDVIEAATEPKGARNESAG
jgi:hypothetical protein